MLWITGAPGLGKSTVAQMLGRDHGFVCYEGDCFGNCMNPYIPLEAESPSLAQWNQKVLRGGVWNRGERLSGMVLRLLLNIFLVNIVTKINLKNTFLACVKICSERGIESEVTGQFQLLLSLDS